MIGDSWRDDIQGAGQLSMKTIWLNRFGAPTPDGDHDPDHEITNLEELFLVFDLLES